MHGRVTFNIPAAMTQWTRECAIKLAMVKEGSKLTTKCVSYLS